MYKVLSGTDAEKVQDLLTEIGAAETNRESAYMGVLLMKNAGNQDSPVSKLSMFKDGRELLETAISNDPDNAEYRFFRLLIQENAPRILGYNDDLKDDSTKVIASFSNLSSELKNAILAYSKDSKVISAKDLD